MTFQFWDPAALSTMFNSNTQTASFPAHVSAYFRRPAKIVKPGSRNNSPRSNGRRRMTTTGHFPIRTRSVVDYHRTPVPHYTQHQQPSSRPISWHPNTMEDIHHSQMSYQPMIDNYMATPYSTAEVNGLITPMSYPLMDEPQIQELIAPLEELSANDPNAHYRNDQAFSTSDYWLPQQQMKEVPYDFNNGCIYPDINYQSWYVNNQHQINMVPTAPASPNYLPMPNNGAPLAVPIIKPETEKEELVGMGLYDSPAQVQTSALLLGDDVSPAQRKTLKLEDAFEPSPSSEDEEDDGQTEEENELPSNDHAIADMAETMEEIALPSAEYVYLMNNNQFMMNQWPTENQVSYGWI